MSEKKELSLTIELLVPVKGADGFETTELTMRELTVDENIVLERQGAGKGPLENDKAFFAMCCGVSPDVIGKLGQRDWRRLQNRFYATLGKSDPEPATSV